MAEEPTVKRDDTVTALCPECGDLIEVRDVRSLILTLHQKNVCTEVSSLVSGE